VNSTINNILEVAKYIIPSVVVFLVANSLMRRMLGAELQRKQLEMLEGTQKITIPLRLQAYERLAIFTERIHFRNILPRVYESGMTVADLKFALLYHINSEYEHNISQQIYVTPQVWQSVRHVKEQVLTIIHQTSLQLNPEGSAKELQVKLMEFLVTADEGLANEVALQMINEESRKVLSFGVQV
jgi:hypothetical protein